MNSFQDRFNAGEEARKRIYRAATDLALTHKAQGSTPEGVTVTQHIDAIVDDALREADEGTSSGVTWAYSATMMAIGLEAITRDLRGSRS